MNHALKMMEFANTLESYLHKIIFQAENFYFRGVKNSTKKTDAYYSKNQYLL